MSGIGAEPKSATSPAVSGESGLPSQLDSFREVRRSLEASVLPLATSVDGRRFSFQASMHGLELQVGGYVVLEDEGARRLGQVLTLQLDRQPGNRSLAEEFRRMPGDVTWTQPQPLLVAAAIELSGTEGVPSVTALDAAEGILERLPADDEIPARLAAARIRLSVSRRAADLDAAASAAAAAEALLGQIPERLVTRHPEIRAQILSGRGAVELWADRLDEAAATFSSAASASPSPDGMFAQADCLGYLALVEALRGRLSHAVELAGEASGAADSSNGVAEPAGPAANVALAYVHLERNELRQVRGQLGLADGALRIAPGKLTGAIACQVAARCLLAQGGTKAALEMVTRARRDSSLPRWLERGLMLIQSRVYATAGESQSAIDVVGRAEPRPALDVAVALAHARLAAGDHQAAGRALAAGVASPGEPPEQVRLEGWLMDARLSYGAGDGVRGRRSLEQALRLGKPERLRLAFALERAWIRPVLRRDPELAHAYQDLLEPGLMTSSWLPVRRSDTGEAVPVIVEQLSERESEVLRHLSGMLSTAEIATEM